MDNSPSTHTESTPQSVSQVRFQIRFLLFPHWVAVATSYIRVLHFCGQVPFLYVIIVGFVAVGKARLSRSTSRCTTWSTEDHGTPHSAHSRSAVLPHAEQMTLQRWKKNVCTVARPRHFHTHHISRAALSYTYTYIHSFIHSYIHTYVRTHIHAYYLFTYFHTQSFTTSFVFPSFPFPATTFEAQYWKKLNCGGFLVRLNILCT